MNAATNFALKSASTFLDDPLFIIKLIVVLLCLQVLVDVLLVVFTRFERTITVKSKEPYSTGEGRSFTTRNVVSDSEGRLYSVRSAPLLLHFSSAEVFATLKEGATFKVAGYGVRVPLLGWYPTLMSAEAT